MALLWANSTTQSYVRRFGATYPSPHAMAPCGSESMSDIALEHSDSARASTESNAPTGTALVAREAKDNEFDASQLLDGSFLQTSEDEERASRSTKKATPSRKASGSPVLELSSKSEVSLFPARALYRAPIRPRDQRNG